jgi:tetratricopeptide (TPR) repeat protein
MEKTSAATEPIKARKRLRFDLDAVRELAGKKVFARGEEYYRDGEVEILVIEPGRVLAQVSGTEDYRSELTGQGKDFDGACSCRAFEDWGFCKHLVATALAANDFRADEAEGNGTLGRIREHLKEKGIAALVEMIVKLAEHDLVLFRRLTAAATATHADDKTLTASLRKSIDNATRTGGFVEYRETSDWAAEVDGVLDTIEGLASGARAGLALELAERAIDRIEQAIESVDDSDGYCGALMERSRDIHLAAVREVRPEPKKLARDLFDREMGDVYGTFDGALELYADVLGEVGQAEYRRLATEAWEKLTPAPGRRQKEEQEFSGNRYQLMRILDVFAERAGDVDARIALRAADLSSQWSHLQLAEFCLAQGRGEEALRRAEEGLWLFEDARPDERLVLFTTQLLSKAGRKADAEAHLQRAFEKAPTLELYKRLRKSGGEAAREHALKFLEAGQGRRQGMGWHDPAFLLIQIYIQEKMFDAAWAVVRKHPASISLAEQLAQASEATHPREALEVYTTSVERLVNSGSGYEEAVKLIARMAKLRDSKEQVTYVLELKLRHGRKRNFMKLLG